MDDLTPRPDDAAEREYQSLLKRRLDVLRQQRRMQADLATAARAEAAAYTQSPQYVRDRLHAIQEERRLLADRQRADQMARTADLRQRYGAFGGIAAGVDRFRQSRFGQAVGGGVTAFGAAVGAGARSGFSGTVEQNRLDYEMQLLNRELAGAFKPLIELFTAGATRVRKFLESLGEGGQNALMYGGLAAGAFGLSRLGGRALGGIAGGMFGGLPGALAGAAMMGGGRVAPAGGGAMGPAAMAALAASSAGGGGGAAAAGAGGRSLMGRVARFPIKHPLITAAVLAGTSAMLNNVPEDSQQFRTNRGAIADRMDTESTDQMLAEYQRLRKGRGPLNRTASFFGQFVGAQGAERDTIEEYERRLQARGVTPGTGKRTVTPDQFGYEEVGSAYRRASISFLSTQPNDGTSGEPKTPEQALAAAKNMRASAESGSAVEAALDKMIEKLEEISRNTDKKAEVR